MANAHTQTQHTHITATKLALEERTNRGMVELKKGLSEGDNTAGHPRNL